MKPSEELLAIREKCVDIIDRFEAAKVVHWSSVAAWSYVYRVCGGPTVREWITRPDRTHLEVVELIERAAACALKEEGAL